MTIVRINEFSAAPNQAAGLRAFLSSVIATVTEAPGCLHCELLVDPEDPARLVIIEDAGHFAFSEQPARGVLAVREFLARSE